MATVYSLVCWGGKDGKSVSGAIATDILTLTNHGLRTGTAIVPQTTVSGVTAGTTYYVNYISANTFYLYNTLANAQAGTSTGRIDITATTAFVCKSLYYLSLADKSRWTTAGTERIYDGVKSWKLARASAGVGLYDTEACEIGEAFTDTTTTQIDLDLLCNSQVITTTINGIRTAAFHGGSFSSGYTLYTNNSAIRLLSIVQYNIAIDGIKIQVSAAATAGGSYGMFIWTGGQAAIIKNNLIDGGTRGISLYNYANQVYNNIIINATIGIYSNGVANSISRIYNNLITKCTTGTTGAAALNRGFYYNNIVVGNTTNYGPPMLDIEGAAYNYGDATDNKIITGNYPATNDIMFTAHGRVANQPIQLTTTGILPAPLAVGTTYYVKTVTSANAFTLSATSGGTVITITDNGTGTHYISNVWVTDFTPRYIDMSVPNNVFVDYTNNDFRPANHASAVQINGGMNVYQGYGFDLIDAVRPNYEAATYPNNIWDAGPFEFDHGEGLAPMPAVVTITAPVSLSGAEIRIYDLDNSPAGSLGTELAGTESHGSATYAYTGLAGNSIWIQIMLAGYEEFGQQLTVPSADTAFYATLKQDLNI